MATYSSRPAIARVRLHIRLQQWQCSVALRSCSDDMVFILGTWYFNLRVLSLVPGKVYGRRTRHRKPPFDLNSKIPNGKIRP